jgi:hypothetical protein
LLRFFFAVGKRNEVPPRTVANSAKQETPTSTPRKHKQNRPNNPKRQQHTLMKK